MSRLLFNATNSRSEGSIVLMQQLLAELLSADPALTITLYLNPDIQNRLQAYVPTLGQNAHRIELIPFRPRGAIRRFLWEQFTLPRVIRRKNIDLLFSFSNTGPRFPGCRQILYLQHSIPYTRFIPRHHQWSWHLHQWLYGKLIGLAQQGSQRIIVPTRWLVQPMRRSILKQKPAEAYHVTLPGIPGSLYATSQKAFAPHEIALLESLERWRASDEKILLYPCYLAPYKHIPYLLDAVRCLLRQNIPPFRLLLTFNADSREHFGCKTDVLDAVDRCGTDRVLLTGSLSHAAIRHVYRMTDILVFPSLVETLGLPLLEAMAHGIPVVATQSDTPQATEAAFARDICGDGAVYADPNSPASFAKALGTLLNDPALAFETGLKGKQRAEKLSWREHVAHILNA